jgi:hypothetical protein
MLRRKFSLAIVVYLLLPAVASADSVHGRVAVYAIGQPIRSFYGEDRCLVRIDEATGLVSVARGSRRSGNEAANPLTVNWSQVNRCCNRFERAPQ